MLTLLRSSGYMSLTLSLLMTSLLSCLMILTQLSHLYYLHVQSSRHYLVAYAASLSGLRLAAHYQDHITSTLIESPTKYDFESLPFFTYQGISFKLLQSPFYIYAYGSYDETHCILKRSLN